MIVGVLVLFYFSKNGSSFGSVHFVIWQERLKVLLSGCFPGWLSSTIEILLGYYENHLTLMCGARYGIYWLYRKHVGEGKKWVGKQFKKVL